MKRTFMLLVVAVLCCALLPAAVFATTFEIPGTDMTIDIDDSLWYVFTRENIQDNPELTELGLSYEYMNTTLRANDAYLDACLFYKDGNYIELFVIKTEDENTRKIVNFADHPDSRIQELSESIAEQWDGADPEVYQTQYKYVCVEGETGGYYLQAYVTVVNKQMYTLKFQSSAPFNQDEYAMMEQMVDSVRFDVDTSLKAETDDDFFDTVLGHAAVGAVIGGTVGGVIGLIGKKAKDKKKKEEPIQTTEE